MFNLKGLPRELRDKIYGFMLAREIHITATGNDEVPDELDMRNLQHPWPQYREHGPGSYQTHSELGLSERPCLNKFLADRTIYSEAWPIFYSKTAFYFDRPKLEEASVSICLAFLRDRPEHALKAIRSMSLEIGFAPARTLSHWFQYHDWVKLYAMMSQKMSIDTLALRTIGSWRDGESHTGPDCRWNPCHQWLSQIKTFKGLRYFFFESIFTSEIQLEIDRLTSVVDAILADGQGVGERVMLIYTRDHHGEPTTCLTTMNDMSTEFIEKWRRDPYDTQKEIYWDSWDWRKAVEEGLDRSESYRFYRQKWTSFSQ